MQNQVPWQKNRRIGSPVDELKSNLLAVCNNGDAGQNCLFTSLLDPMVRLDSLNEAFKTAISAADLVLARKLLQKANLQIKVGQCSQRNQMEWLCCEAHHYAASWSEVILDSIQSLNKDDITQALGIPYNDRIKAKLTEYLAYDPLVRCVEEADFEVLQFLLHAGLLPDWNCNGEAQTALLTAASNGQCQMVLQLLDAGACINAENVFAQTALSQALKNRHFDIVTLLISRGAHTFHVFEESREFRSMSGLKTSKP